MIAIALFTCSLNGRWWGTNQKTRQQVEIDIMGIADKNTALFGECKWTNEKVDLGVLESLVEKSQLLKFEDMAMV